MSLPTTIVQQLAATLAPYPKLTVKNRGASLLKAGTAVVIDANNLIADANALAMEICVAAPSGTDGSAGVLGWLVEDLDYDGSSAGGQSTAPIIPRGPVVPMKSDGVITAGGQVMITTDNSAGHTPGNAKALTGGRPAFGIAITSSADLEDVLVMMFPGS
jgi:hypothetical protein